MKFVISLLSGALCLALAGSASANSPSPQPLQAKAKAPKEKRSSKHRVQVMVLHATNSKKGIDKRIGKMPELKKPPFSSYDSYELLEKKQLPLAKGDASKLVLPNKRVLRTKLLDVISKDQVRISASINRPKGKTFLPLLEVKAKVGQSFIVAGQSYKGGILVLVIKVLGAAK